MLISRALVWYVLVEEATGPPRTRRKFPLWLGNWPSLQVVRSRLTCASRLCMDVFISTKNSLTCFRKCVYYVHCILMHTSTREHSNICSYANDKNIFLLLLLFNLILTINLRIMRHDQLVISIDHHLVLLAQTHQPLVVVEHGRGVVQLGFHIDLGVVRVDFDPRCGAGLGKTGVGRVCMR